MKKNIWLCVLLLLLACSDKDAIRQQALRSFDGKWNLSEITDGGTGRDVTCAPATLSIFHTPTAIRLGETKLHCGVKPDDYELNLSSWEFSITNGKLVYENIRGGDIGEDFLHVSLPLAGGSRNLIINLDTLPNGGYRYEQSYSGKFPTRAKMSR